MGQYGAMTSKSVLKNVPMIETGFSLIKQRRGFALVRSLLHHARRSLALAKKFKFQRNALYIPALCG
jgi:hypothetical protein